MKSRLMQQQEKGGLQVRLSRYIPVLVCICIVSGRAETALWRAISGEKN